MASRKLVSLAKVVGAFIACLCAGCGGGVSTDSGADVASVRSALTAPWRMKQAPLMTPWASLVTPGNSLPEYPRPQMVRSSWLNLNGVWQFSEAQPGEPVPTGQDLPKSILVPFPMESAISGVMQHSDDSWYRRTFTLPGTWSGKTVMLNFGAVDWEAEVFVNGSSVGVHRGGYDPFSFDITSRLRKNGLPEELIVRVHDPIDDGGQPLGKQTRYPGGIFYTSSSGIWQTVWLEPVSAMRIAGLTIVPDIDARRVKIVARRGGSNSSHTMTVTVRDGTTAVATATGRLDAELAVSIPNPKLWSPTNPFLYNLEIQVSSGATVYDKVTGYFGMRKVHVADDNGTRKIFLNNQPIFQVGPLDQGFWPDGLYTAPTDAALKWDLQQAKAFGFNMVRKHMKVEPQRWYYWADKLGLLVWQDMPRGGDFLDDTQKAQFETELRAMIENLRNAPSVILWAPFNEGWGQFDTERFVSIVEALDGTRLVTPASGWNDVEAGDVLDDHSYPGPSCPMSRTRAAVVGEYGGAGLTIAGHIWGPGDTFSQAWVPDAQGLAEFYERKARQGTSCKTLNGLSALVYTQLTDVEMENSGLITYDRKVIKPDVARIAAANTAAISSVLTLRELVSTSRITPKAWKYLSGPSADAAPPGWQMPAFDDRAWATGLGGFGTDGTPGAVVRTTWAEPAIWLRQTFWLPSLTSQDLTHLMFDIHHDETATIYFNGVQAAQFGGYLQDYELVPMSQAGQAALRPGQSNLLAVECLQTDGGQYIDVGITQWVEGEPASFSDDFDDGNADGWTTYGGNWSVSSGEYVAEAGGDFTAIAGTYFEDLTYDADVTIGAAGNAGLVFRVTKPAEGSYAFNGYYVGLDAASDRVEIGKAAGTDTSWAAMASAPVVLNPGTRHHLEVVAIGSALRVFVDDVITPKITIHDGTFTAGAVGVRAYCSNARFDNVSVTKN